MKKKDFIIYCIIAFIFFLIFLSSGLPLIFPIIGALGFLLAMWADAKQENDLRKKIEDEMREKIDEEVAKKVEEQSAKIMEELKTADTQKRSEE